LVRITGIQYFSEIDSSLNDDIVIQFLKAYAYNNITQKGNTYISNIPQKAWPVWQEDKKQKIATFIESIILDAPASGEELIQQFLSAYRSCDKEKCFMLACTMDDETFNACLGMLKTINDEQDRQIEKINATTKTQLAEIKKEYESIIASQMQSSEVLKPLKALELRFKSNCEEFYEVCETNGAYQKRASLVHHKPAEPNPQTKKQMEEVRWKLENKQAYLIRLIDELIREIQSRAPDTDKEKKLAILKSKVEQNMGAVTDYLTQIERVCSERRNFFDPRTTPKSLLYFNELEQKRKEVETSLLNEEKQKAREVKGSLQNVFGIESNSSSNTNPASAPFSKKL